jgi:hypothetical protein
MTNVESSASKRRKEPSHKIKARKTTPQQPSRKENSEGFGFTTTMLHTSRASPLSTPTQTSTRTNKKKTDKKQL